MSNIIINPTGGQLSVGLKSNSLLAVAFSVTIYEPDGTTIAEHYVGDTSISNPVLIQLPKPAATYRDYYVVDIIKFFDPVGSESYDIEVYIEQNSIILSPIIPLKGTSSNGINSKETIFHIQ